MNGVTLAGIAFLVWNILAWILKIFPIPHPSIRYILSAAAVVLTFVPFGPYSLAMLIYGATAELSVTAVALLILALLRKHLRRKGQLAAEKRLLAAVVVVFGLMLYPGVLGFRYHDFYADGYAGGLFGYFLITVVSSFAVLRLWKLAGLFILAGIAWRLSLGNSSNLWDYVLDIWVFMWAWGVWIRYGLHKLRHRGMVPSVEHS